MQERHEPTRRAVEARPPFLWVASGLGAMALAVFGTGGARALQHRADTRVHGFTEAWQAGGWSVAAVATDGPAAGKLQPGDRILAVDGDPRATTAGGLWFVERIEPARPYRVQVLRGSRPITATLTVWLRRESHLAWVLVCLSIASAFFTVAIVMAVAKPRSPTVRYGYVTSMLTAGFMVWLATRPVGGTQHDAIACLLALTFPLQLMAGLLFFDGFPHAVPARRWWKHALRLLLTLGGAIWAARAWLALLQLLPERAASLALDRSLGFLGGYRSLGPPVESAYSGAVLAVMFALLVRNYRLLASRGERRRIQLVLWSHMLALVPMALVAVGSSVLQSLGVAARDSRALLAWTLAGNALLIISPLSFGYAIVKHRVFGFRVFVRTGIQHMLAQNVLRTAAALPALVIAYGIVSNPDRTVGQALYSAWSGGQLALIGLAAAGLRFRAPLAAAIDRRFFRAAYDQERILLRLVDSIKQLDSREEIAALVSREIDAALHVARISVFYRSTAARSLELGYSSGAEGREAGLPLDSPLLAELAQTPRARTRDELDRHCAPPERAWLDRMQTELVVPIAGIEHDLGGLLLIGEKRSEEPFTAKDRNLLQMIAAQVGAVHEILTLRERVGQHQRIQSEVLARLEHQQINIVKECPRCGLCCDSGVARCPEDGEGLVPSLPVDRCLDGKYRLERLLGHGGMGAVYRASDLRLNRGVAVKVLRSSALASSALQRRFAREAQACGRLTHPNIVRVYDFGVVGDTAYLVLEYVDGVTWRAELERLGRLPPGQAATLLDQVLDGMDAAHLAGVLHRDLKPENLLLCSAQGGGAPLVKILDFGLAKVREASFADPKSQTQAGVVMGTVGYMSPEQLRGEEVDERTDVYALGVIALEAVTGRLPLAGRFFHQAIDGELTRRLALPATGTAQRRLAEGLRRALAPEASDRIASMRELRAVLIPALRGCPELSLPDAPGQAGQAEPQIPTLSRALGEATDARGGPTEARRRPS